jgi:hypothetical protein
MFVIASLCISLLQHLLNARNHSVRCFYCDYTPHGEKKARKLVLFRWPAWALAGWNPPPPPGSKTRPPYHPKMLTPWMSSPIAQPQRKAVSSGFCAGPNLQKKDPPHFASRETSTPTEFPISRSSAPRCQEHGLLYLLRYLNANRISPLYAVQRLTVKSMDYVATTTCFFAATTSPQQRYQKAM